MNCANCINRGRLCLSCGGQFYAEAVKKPERKPSAWERRWIKWAEKQKTK